MAFFSVSLPKAKEQYQEFLDAIIKRRILDEILEVAGTNPGDVKEDINFTSFGTTYTFTDKTALQEATTQPQRFIGDNDREIVSSLRGLSSEQLLKLIIEGELVPASNVEDLRILIPSYKKVIDGGTALTFKNSKKSIYTLVKGSDPKNPVEELIGAANIDIEGLGAPVFAEFLTPLDESTPSWDKPVDVGDFNNTFRNIINAVIDLDPQLTERKRELTPGVIEKLLGDIQAEQAARDFSNFTTGREVEGFEDVIEEYKELPRLTPFDFQCFLLENISKFVDLRQDGGPFQTLYSNIVKVTSEGDPGNVINTIEHGNRTNSVREFLNICPEVYGLLTPYLKISRIEYDEDGNIKIENNRPVVKDLKIPNFLSQDDIQDILAGNTGRTPGAGIKSFSWGLDGVQPAEVDNNISATLVMYFQSVNDFFNGARSAGQDQPNFLDLIINSPAVRKQKERLNGKKEPDSKPCNSDLLRKNAHQEYAGNNYRVKICAGWATPPEKALLDLVKNPTKVANLITAIEESKISLFLQMTQHQINFNQNGSLELNVQYQASLAGLLTGKTANIFDVTSKKIEEQIEAEENKIDEIDVREERERSLPGDDERKKKLLDKIKELRNEDRNTKYKKLLNRLYDSKKIYNITVNPDELRLAPYSELSPTARQRRVKRKLESKTFDFDAVRINDVILNEINRSSAANSKELAEAYSNEETKRFDELVNEEKINIPFFFLGDLFDNILDQIKINKGAQAYNTDSPLNFQFLISDVEMIDPLQAFKLKNLEDLINCGYNLKDIVFLDAVSKETPTNDAELNGIYRTMNIGDIPISLDAFQLWFKDNVVKKDRENYFFLYFVKDICKALITKALSSKCFGKEFSFQQRFDAQPITFAKHNSTEPRFPPNQTVRAVNVAKAKASMTCNLDPRLTELGLLLYPTDSHPKDLNGKFEPDLRRGIYHHYLGSECGIVKQINFNRQDQAYLRESRIQKEGALGAEQLRELYSANLELIGNTLYKNGMYIYINPSLLDADRDYLDYLGLHGYYLVTSVQSKISPSSFDVSITALHEGVEFNNQKLLPSADLGQYELLRPEDPPRGFRLKTKQPSDRAGVPGGGQNNAGYRVRELPPGTTSNDAYDDITF